MSSGLQPERTGLSWQRSALAAGVCALLLVRHAAVVGWGIFTIPAVLAAATALILTGAGALRERQLQDVHHPVFAVLLGAAAALSAATAITSLVVLMW